jgi:hypothetical protein
LPRRRQTRATAKSANAQGGGAANLSARPAPDAAARIARYHSSQVSGFKAEIGNFSRLVNQLETQRIICELWVDGSFLTETIEPNDVDLSVCIHAHDFDALDIAIKEWIIMMLSDQKFSPLLDTYVCINYLRDDPRRIILDRTAYWGGWWSGDRDGRAKGYAVIKLGETDVGHRICS